MINPWIDIKKNCYKRITRDLNLFYAISQDEDYLLIIDLDDLVIKDRKLNLKGFELYQYEEDNKCKIYLKLKESKNWEIFYQLCNDLVYYAQKAKGSISKAIISRLVTWQSFLSSENRCFPFEKQLGLLGELTFLTETLAINTSLKNAIIAWVGPERDKQDFRLNNVSIEVKTYLDNKKEKVHISSLEQLNQESGLLFLYAIGAKISEDGLTIKDIFNAIKKNIIENCPEELSRFEQLVFEYGYNPLQEYDNLEKLSIFESACWKVENDFPKLPLTVKNDAISNVNYVINLALCSKFRVLEDVLITEIKKEL